MPVLFSCRQQLHLSDAAAPFSLLPSHPVLFFIPPRLQVLAAWNSRVFFKRALPRDGVSQEFPGELQSMMGLMGSELQKGREKRLSNIT